MTTLQPQSVSEHTSLWTPEVERFLAEQTEFTALPFNLQLLSQARGALFFFDGQALYAEFAGGAINSKFVSTEGARSAFFYESSDSGWMPPQIKRHGQTTKGYWAVQHFPPQKYVLELGHPHDSAEREPTKLTVTLPSLVFFGYRNDYYVWAAEGDSFNPYANIFHIPVPNVYGAGRICFGGNTEPEVTGPNLDAGWDLFLRSPYNCAHAVRRSQRFPGHICVALYEHVAEHGEEVVYPVSDLLPYYMTVDDALNKILNGLGMPAQARNMGGGMIMHSFTEPEDELAEDEPPFAAEEDDEEDDPESPEEDGEDAPDDDDAGEDDDARPAAADEEAELLTDLEQ